MARKAKSARMTALENHSSSSSQFLSPCLSPWWQHPIALYVFAATLARTSTGGAIVAVVLLSTQFNGSGKTAGILAACLTLPHLFGPLFGKWLDRLAKPKFLIGGASMCYSLSFGVAIWSFHQQLPWPLTFSLLLCGACGSFIMGGLGTQLKGLTELSHTSLRRAQSWDTITYGVGHTIGPLIIAGFTALFSPLAAISTLSILPFIAGLLIFKLPTNKKGHSGFTGKHVGFRDVLVGITSSASLSRTVLMTAGAAFSLAALPVIAVYLSIDWQQPEHFGAYLVSAYGIGNLCGASFIVARPLKNVPLTLMRNIGLILCLSLLVVAISPFYSAGMAGYWLCGVANALFFASSLAARTEYAPRDTAAQIYMWVAAAKIGAGALGALVAGWLFTFGATTVLVFSLTSLGIIILVCFNKRQ